MPAKNPISDFLRVYVGGGLALIEDVVYAGLGILLAVAAGALLVVAMKDFGASLLAGNLQGQVITLLDQLLLILLIIELLYTIQVSFREHRLLVEPFLVVALIAVIRRILVLTAELHKPPEAGGALFTHALTELALLTVMVLVLVIALVMLLRQSKREEREEQETQKPS
jgi:uncharacterized membrane protein (DUF373 family)